MLSQTKGRRDGRLKAFGRYVHNHPLLSAMVFTIVLVAAGQTIHSVQETAYRKSPEGMAETLKLKAASDRAQVEEINRSRTNTDIAGLKVWLRDPASAQFTDTRHFQKNGKEVTCGSVNSRNGFGGMGGFQPFAVVDYQVNLSQSGAAAKKVIGAYCG